MDCTCKGSRLRASHENLILGDLRWSGGGDANAGEQLQMQIVTSRRSDNTETMRNQWLAFSYQSERQATDKLHLVAGFIVASELMNFSCTVASGGRL